MYSLNRTGSVRATNIWPAFVDGLAALILVFTFILLFFTFAQFFLAVTLTQREQDITVLDRRLAELTDLLNLEQTNNEELRKTTTSLQETLQATLTERDDIATELAGLKSRTQNLEGNLASSLAGRDAIVTELNELRQRLQESENQNQLLFDLRQRLESDLEESTSALTLERELSGEQEREVTLLREDNVHLAEQAALLNQQLGEIRAQLAALSEALDASEAKNRVQQVEILTLGNRLNAALAGKVQELAGYRSEFFGRLREALGDNPNIRIAGDRFILQSEVLFQSGSAELGIEGLARIQRLGVVLKDISVKIPPEVDWVLRIDGHTDIRPINTARFPSNWELSSARAISVVRALIEEGIPAHRLAPTGFGEFQPLLTGNDEASLARNRRIEFKLTER
ncbi:MAG: peptidoglycan -binding protein [Alphaproteobacteria bacterium]